MGFLKHAFVLDDAPVENYESTVEFMNSIRDFVFTFIEKMVILAAIEIALKREGVAWLYLIYFIAWAVFALSLLTYARMMIAMTLENVAFARKHRKVFRVVGGLLSASVSFGLTYLLPAITAEFIAANFFP